MISIIGAGPAGCYTAYLLAKAGKEVQIFEEHKEIGLPIQCTGLVTSSINNILNLKKDIIINEVDKVKIFSPKKKFFELKLKNKNLILDRKKFDNYLADLAISKGAKIFLNYKFIDNKNNLIKVKYNNEKETILKTDYLIGADGPLSQVAKSNNLAKERKLMTGIQAVAKLKNENCIEFYPSIKTFAWVVPENQETCRIGVASYNNPKEEFSKFLKTKNISQKDITEIQGGLIPIYNPKLKTKKDNIYLVGDAASQVKATSIDGEECILIKKNNLIRTVKIREFITPYLDNNKESIKTKKDYQKLDLREDIFAYSPTNKAIDLKFRRIGSIIKHKIDEALFEITLERGYKIKVTGSHSVITIGKEKLIPKKVTEIKKDDNLLVTLNIPNNTSLKKINLIKFIKKEYPQLIDNIRVKGGKHLIFNKSSQISRRYRSAYWGRDSIPLKLFLDKNITPKDVKIFFMPSKKSIYLPNMIKITPDFCRLLGYFIAEGCSKNGKNVYLIFGKEDKKNKIIEDALKCIQKSWKIMPNLQKPRRNPSNKKVCSFPVFFGGSLLSLIFTEVFRTGKNTKNKEVPFIIFNVPNKQKLEFLKGYLRGDGYLRIRMPKKKKNWGAEITAKTASRKLASDLITLSLQLGLLPSINTELTKERTLYEKKIRKSYIYKITYSRKKDLEKLKDVFKNKRKKLDFYLSKTSGRSTININKNLLTEEIIKQYKKEFTQIFGKSFYLAYKTLSYEKIKKVLDTSKINDKTSILIGNLIKNDIAVLPVKRVKRVKSKWKDVFDIEIPETNMFVGGIGPILLHNTGGGIIQGLKAAQALADSITKNKDYEKEWKKEINKDLLLHLKMRKIMNRFKEKDWDLLINLFKKDKTKNIIESFDRDYPSKFMVKLAISEPRLLYFLKFLF